MEVQDILGDRESQVDKDFQDRRVRKETQENLAVLAQLVYPGRLEFLGFQAGLVIKVTKEMKDNLEFQGRLGYQEKMEDLVYLVRVDSVEQLVLQDCKDFLAFQDPMVKKVSKVSLPAMCLNNNLYFYQFTSI